MKKLIYTLVIVLIEHCTLNKLKIGFNKRFISLLFLLTCFYINAISQNNITNTLGTGGIFKIKDASNNFFTLTQSTGLVNILGSLRFENTANSSIGIIFKGADRFLHNYGSYNLFLGVNSGNFTLTGTANTSVGYNSLLSITTGRNNLALGDGSLSLLTDGYENTAVGSNSLHNNTGLFNTGVGCNSLSTNTTGYQNTAVGSNSLMRNTTGQYNAALGVASLWSNTTGSQNTSIGSYSLLLNTSGSNNTAVGYYSLPSNNTGNNNTALGFQSLYKNTASNNTAVGNQSLYNNTTGFENTAVGCNSLFSNTTGSSNTTLGMNTLGSNTTGSDNTVLGMNTLVSNNIGSGNTAIGRGAMYYNTSGNNNTVVGFNAGNITTGNNNIAIGYFAQVPDGTASNQVRIGNTDVTYAGVQVAWTITSDRRWKKNITSTELGLDFISKLNPVSYTRINNERQKTEYGFIAQDIEEVLNEYKIDNSGMITKDYEGRYELRYNDLLAPMVKAIQELNERNIGLKSEVDDLKSRLTALEQKSGIQNQQSAGFLSGNINLNYLFLLLFSTAGFTFLTIKKLTKK